jgi:hypothetical protein
MSHNNGVVITLKGELVFEYEKFPHLMIVKVLWVV